MAEPAFFDTSERTERLQLLIHLVNNTQDLLYLRGPHGSGKTRFAQQLARLVAADFQVVWLSAAAELPLSEQLSAQIDLSQDDASELELVFQSDSDKPALLIVDDADGLDPADFEQLQTPGRPETRILLLGAGSLVYPGNGQRVQFVDLPPFTEAQSRAFVEAQGLPGGAVDERVVVSLHRAARGQPGPLLDALAGLPAAEGQSAGGSSGFSWRWGLFGGGLAIVVLVVLVFQGRINQWFAPPPPLPGSVPEGIVAGSPSDVAEEEPAPAAVPAPEEAATPITRITPATDSTAPGSSASATLPSPLAGQADIDSGPGDGEAADPILDAVIDAAISAAEELPQEKNGARLAELPADSAPRALVESAPSGESIASVEAESSPIAAPKPVVEPAQAPTPAAPEAPAKRTPVKEGLAWVRTQPAAHYTLQLVGSRDRTSIDKFIRQHRITGPHAVFVRDLNGRPWYSLVSGSYPDREAALAGLAKLPRGLSGAWPRTFASIRQLIRSSGTPAANQ